MKKLMHIIATPRGGESRTLKVSAAFLDAFKKNQVNWVIDTLDIAKEKLPPLTLKQVGGKYALLSGKDLYGEFKEAWKEIVAHIERFLSADLYLISVPMWNFNIPYMFKQYIDIIVQPKYLFQYTKTGVEGLAKNKKMVVITSRGGEYVSEAGRKFDHQEPYLRTVFGFVGITDIIFINAQPMDMGPQIQEEKLKEAARAARELSAKING